MGHRATVTAISARRPELLGDDARRFWNLVWTLAVTDWKLKFYGSFLGYMWTLARPFAFFGVIYVVFTEIAGVGAEIENYGICILFSMVLFQFFSEATIGSVTSVIRRENLLRKMRFPRLAIPLSTVLTALMNFGATLVAVIVFASATGVYPTWGWLELPLLVAALAVLGTGTGMLLSVLYVRYRDVEPIWDVATQILFYASPILYVATMVPEDYQRVYLFNPLAALLTQVRHAVVDPTAPTAADLIGGAGWLLVPAAITVAIVALGVWAFRREAPRIAERL
jgi:ABC-2 type transport system permease protein